MLKTNQRRRNVSGKFITEYNIPFDKIKILYNEKGIALRKIAEHFKCDRDVIKKILIENGIKIRNNKESRQPGTKYHKWSKRRFKGEKHPNFKGKTRGHGYINIWKNGKKHIQHRYIMESILKRKLKNGEFVHHIDGDRENNNKANLVLCNRKTHQSMHSSLQRVSYVLIKNGLIKFDRKLNEYYLRRKE